MGMLDIVHITCPACEKEIEIQTKAGICEFLKYHSDNVPADIAMALNKHKVTCLCGTSIQLTAIVPRVKMTITKLTLTTPEWD